MSPSPSETNPYRSPVDCDGVEPDEALTTYTWQVRAALLLLAVPMWANLACIFRDFNEAGFPRDLKFVLLGWNILWMSLLTGGSLLFGAGLCEWLAGLLHSIFGGASTREDWIAAYRAGLWPLPRAAAIGAALWLAWLYLFFFSDVRYVAPISLAMSVVGWGLGGWVVATLIGHWRELRAQAEKTRETSEVRSDF